MDDCELARGFYSNNDTLVDDCPGGVGVPCALRRHPRVCGAAT